MEDNTPTLLVFNCHESWIYQLSNLDFDLDIIVGLSGRYHADWDNNMRPLPPRARLIPLDEAQTTSKQYHCIITHNITDLLDVKNRSEARILMLHSTLEGKTAIEQPNLSSTDMKRLLDKYVSLTNTHVVAISELKGNSWGQSGDIVPNCVNPADYLPHLGNIAKGLRISNFINKREKILLWDVHQAAFKNVPVTIVGHNPQMPGVQAAENWQDLKKIMQAHRFYIHTAEPALEDGYNMASFEAMAAGLPVIGNAHPTSVITHGVDGFLSNDPTELGNYAELLINDIDLAKKMGEAARQTIEKHYSHTIFCEKFLNAIKTARQKTLPAA
jgi:hypothetical protein